MAAAVPLTAEFWANMVLEYGWVKTWLASNKIANPPYGQDPALAMVYYDGQYCAWKLRDYTDDAGWDALIQDTWEAYVPYYVVPANGGVQGYRNFTEGPLEDVLRGSSRSAASKAAIQLIIDNSNFVNSDNLSSYELSRECAYALMALINAQRAGITLTVSQAARIPVLKDWCLGHIDQWCTSLTAEFYRPFMGGITAHALTMYSLYISEDADILAALIVLANHTWTTSWKATDGVWGQGKSFLYTDRVGTVEWWASTDDANTAPDLNMMIAPLWAYLWWKTGVSTWRSNGDLIFEGGVTVYDGDGFRQYGAYAGSSGNPSGKQIDQQMIYGVKYLDWAVLDFNDPPPPPDIDPPPPDPTPTPITVVDIPRGVRGTFRVSRKGIRFTY